tara:strand:- start:288 stop:599 length:312 start_codon:yes stop_codon:yes gene_type:complete
MIMPEYITDSKKQEWECVVERRHGLLPEDEMLVEVCYDSEATIYQIQNWRLQEFKEWALVIWAAEIENAHDIIIPETAVDTLLDALEIAIEEVNYTWLDQKEN